MIVGYEQFNTEKSEEGRNAFLDKMLHHKHTGNQNIWEEQRITEYSYKICRKTCLSCLIRNSVNRILKVYCHQESTGRRYQSSWIKNTKEILIFVTGTGNYVVLLINKILSKLNAAYLTDVQCLWVNHARINQVHRAVANTRIRHKKQHQ